MFAHTSAMAYDTIRVTGQLKIWGQKCIVVQSNTHYFEMLKVLQIDAGKYFWTVRNTNNWETGQVCQQAREIMGQARLQKAVWKIN